MSVIYINLYNYVICIFKKLLTKAAFGCSVETSSHFSLSLSLSKDAKSRYFPHSCNVSVCNVGFFYISYLYWIVYEYLTILCVYHPQYNTSFSLEFIFLFCKTASSSFHFLRYEFARHCWNIILSFYSNVIKTFLYLILNQPQDGRTKPRYYRP